MREIRYVNACSKDAKLEQHAAKRRTKHTSEDIGNNLTDELAHTFLSRRVKMLGIHCVITGR